MKMVPYIIAASLFLTGTSWISAARAGTLPSTGCPACHVPHVPANSGANSGGPLWTPTLDGRPLQTFKLYSSPTFDALNTGITQPDGASKLCLGCHDGTYSTGAGVSAAHAFGPGQALTLSESHPVSFWYDTALAFNPKLPRPMGLRDPRTTRSGVTANGTIATDLLDGNGKMQCTSCHSAHHDGIGQHHLRFNYDIDGGRTMCRTCHNK